jgi:PqqD family protein of HPr-rel-A system
MERRLMALVKPRVRSDLTIVDLDGEATVYDDATGDLHTLNPTATIVLHLCDGSATINELSTELAGVFDTPKEEIEPQVRALLRKFRRAGLLEPDPRTRSEGAVA